MTFLISYWISSPPLVHQSLFPSCQILSPGYPETLSSLKLSPFLLVQALDLFPSNLFLNYKFEPLYVDWQVLDANSFESFLISLPNAFQLLPVEQHFLRSTFIPTSLIFKSNIAKLSAAKQSLCNTQFLPFDCHYT